SLKKAAGASTATIKVATDNAHSRFAFFSVRAESRVSALATYSCSKVHVFGSLCPVVGTFVPTISIFAPLSQTVPVLVAHTLRYRSQVVTGRTFLLAYLTATISHSNIYSLSALTAAGRRGVADLGSAGRSAVFRGRGRPSCRQIRGRVAHRPFPKGKA